MKTIKKFLSISLILLCIIIIFPIRESSLVVHMQQDVRSFIDQQVFNKEDENEETLKVPQEQPFAVNNVQLNMKKG
ncbi:MAG: CAP domain-containing protein, partial [Staphylococcus lugdunensis]|nr:CAP domain-containing protein [Staphylococcus lugdunensis]